MSRSHGLMNPELKYAHRYLYTAEEESRLVQAKKEARDYLMPAIRELGEPDENGNIIWYFDEPLHLGETYSGLMLQRRVSEYTDEEKVREIIAKHGLEDRCIRKVVTYEVDLDEVFACNQEDVISDEEIDSMIVVNENWALVKVK